MRPSTLRAQQGRAIIGKIVLALAVAAVLVGMPMGPAFSDDHDRRPGPPGRDQRAHQPRRRAHQPPRREYQPYGYYAPPPVIYAPPPVVYAPPPSPGISLFFDLPFRHR
jgi:hypothetical protein